MKLYVASAFENRAEVSQLIAQLRADGHEITHDWTTKGAVPARECTPAFLDECGREDLIGVMDADAVILVNHAACRDSMAEFGIALGMDSLLYVLYPDRKPSVFFQFADTFQTTAYLLHTLRTPRG